MGQALELLIDSTLKVLLNRIIFKAEEEEESKEERKKECTKEE